MSSLRGAPNLGGGGGGGGAKKQFTYDVDWNDDDDDDDDDYIPEVKRLDPKPEKKSDAKKEKGKKSSHKASERQATSGKGKEKSSTAKQPVPAKAKVEEPPEEDYEDDFDNVEEDDEFLGSDDDIPPVTSLTSAPPPPPPVHVRRDSPESAKSRGFSDSPSRTERQAVADLEEELRAEKRRHADRIREWEEAQSRKDQEAKKRQAELQREIDALKRQQSTAEDVKKQVESMLAEKLAAAQQNPSSAPLHKRETDPTAVGDAAEGFDKSDDNADRGAAGDAVTGQLQQQRRRQRERERALQLRRLHEEEAARSLFQRLAQDVREVFHELNLSVVAAEKERLIKDERYRRDREAKERKEEMERADRLQREVKERAEREEKFWAAMEEREERLRSHTEERLRKDEEEREARLKRDLEDRVTRAHNERDMRDQVERLESERRAKQEADARQRDTLVLEEQLNEVKAHYTRQIEEVRRQNELAREHSEELHRVELQMMEKRHEAALNKLLLQHSQQLTAMEAHAVNAAKLEKLIENMHEGMEATKKMNERLTDERMSGLQSKEQQLNEQRAVLDAMMADLQDYKNDLEKERTRVVGLYAKFELSLSSFVKNAEEDRRRLQEAQAHFDTLRQQAEKDRRLMLSEVAQERKVLEQQQEELLARKMEAMNEIHVERAELGRERTEAAVARERKNRDEGELLKALRDREQEYATRIESLEADRVSITAMKAEQRELLDRVVAERDALRREREAFEHEKGDLLARFEEVRRRAEDAASSQDRLRRTLVEERACREFGVAGPGTAGAPLANPTGIDALPASVTSRLQMDLARQRAILQKISS